MTAPNSIAASPESVKTTVSDLATDASALASETDAQRTARLDNFTPMCEELVTVALRRAKLDSLQTTARCIGNALSSEVPTVNAKLNAINAVNAQTITDYIDRKCEADCFELRNEFSIVEGE